MVMDLKLIEATFRRMQAEIDQLKRVSPAARLPLAESNIVRVDEPVEALDPYGSDGDLAGVGEAVPHYIGNDDVIHSYRDDEGTERTVTVYNFSGSTVGGGYYFTHRLPDGKRVLSIGGGGGTLYIFSLLPGRSDKFIGDILEVDGEALVAEDQTIEDPLSIFTDLFDAESAEGLCLYQGGKYWAVQAKCPTDAGAS